MSARYTGEHPMYTYTKPPYWIFSFHMENTAATQRADARVKRSDVYSRINSDDRKSNKQIAEEVVIRSGVRISKMLSYELTVHLTVINLFDTNELLLCSEHLPICRVGYNNVT